MKAAVIFQRGENPKFVENYVEPTPGNEGEVLLSIKAVALKHLDKSIASGRHYTAEGEVPKVTIPGSDGVGLLPNGKRVYALGKTGMLADKAIVESAKTVSIPDGLDDAIAAALPNAVAGSATALLYRGCLQPGETVLVHGATGVTGKLAVQLSKYYRAGHIIATGRNEPSLHALKSLGANEVISLDRNEDDFITQIRKIHQETPIDVVIDYLWGKPAERLLSAFKGYGLATHRVRYVSVGSVAGDKIELPAALLRSVDLQLVGSGPGSWGPEEMKQLLTKIIPEVFELAVEGKISMDIVKIPIEEIEDAWNIEVPGGKRLVVTI